MTLRDFVKEQIELLNGFESCWSSKHQENPSLFPEHMEPGDWDEQFSIFTENSK